MHVVILRLFLDHLISILHTAQTVAEYAMHLHVGNFIIYDVDNDKQNNKDKQYLYKKSVLQDVHKYMIKKEFSKNSK